jgi:hypothetical protein
METKPPDLGDLGALATTPAHPLGTPAGRAEGSPLPVISWCRRPTGDLVAPDDVPGPLAWVTTGSGDLVQCEVRPAYPTWRGEWRRDVRPLGFTGPDSWRSVDARSVGAGVRLPHTPQGTHHVGAAEVYSKPTPHGNFSAYRLTAAQIHTAITEGRPVWGLSEYHGGTWLYGTPVEFLRSTDPAGDRVTLAGVCGIRLIDRDALIPGGITLPGEGLSTALALTGWVRDDAHSVGDVMTRGIVARPGDDVTGRASGVVVTESWADGERWVYVAPPAR